MATSNERVWYVWTSTCSSSSNTATVRYTWEGWNEGYTNSSSCTATTNTVYLRDAWTGWNGAYEETAEQKSAREERQARQREEAEAARVAREAAKERAEAILRRHLTQVQEASWAAHGYFDLTLEGDGKAARHYRIRRGTHGNIRRLENGKEVESLCVQPGGVPEADANLAQLLHLQHDEEGLRRIAGIRRLA